jgi:TPR repeat protein
MTLAMMYEQGQGVPKDEVAAKRWYARAEGKG